MNLSLELILILSQLIAYFITFITLIVKLNTRFTKLESWQENQSFHCRNKNLELSQLSDKSAKLNIDNELIKLNFEYIKLEMEKINTKIDKLSEK
jgi:hypothetical protein